MKNMHSGFMNKQQQKSNINYVTKIPEASVLGFRCWLLASEIL
jgi:hypothetical protein